MMYKLWKRLEAVQYYVVIERKKRSLCVRVNMSGKMRRELI